MSFIARLRRWQKVALVVVLVVGRRWRFRHVSKHNEFGHTGT